MVYIVYQHANIQQIGECVDFLSAGIIRSLLHGNVYGLFICNVYFGLVEIGSGGGV